MGLLYGREGRLTALFGGIRPGQCPLYIEAATQGAPPAGVFYVEAATMGAAPDEAFYLQAVAMAAADDGTGAPGSLLAEAAAIT